MKKKLEIDMIWVITALDRIQTRMSELLAEIKNHYEADKSNYMAGATEHGSKAFRYFELLQREIGKGLILVELIKNYALEEDDPQAAQLADIFSKILAAQSPEDSSDSLEGILDELTDMKDAFQKRKRDLSGDSSDDERQSSKESDVKNKAKSMLEQMRDKFKKQ